MQQTIPDVSVSTGRLVLVGSMSRFTALFEEQYVLHHRVALGEVKSWDVCLHPCIVLLDNMQWIEQEVTSLRLAVPYICILICVPKCSIREVARAMRSGIADVLVGSMSDADMQTRIGLAMQQSVALWQTNAAWQSLREAAQQLGGPDTTHSAEQDGSKQPQKNDDSYAIGDVTVLVRRMQCFVAGTSIRLTSIEWQMLLILMRQPQTALAYADISFLLYGRKSNSNESRALLRPHVARLRSKIAALSHEVSIVSIRSFGYMIEETT